MNHHLAAAARETRCNLHTDVESHNVLFVQERMSPKFFVVIIVVIHRFAEEILDR